MVEIYYLDTAGFTEGTYREIWNNLSESRRARAERYRTERAAYLSAGAGDLLDFALQKRGLAEREARYLFGENGKPYLAGGALNFNLSHSGTVAVLAVADGEVGVDVEKIAPVRQSLIERVCTERECAQLMRLSEEERTREFFRYWTAKESVMKYFGAGLSLPPKELEAELTCGRVKRNGAELKLSLREYALSGYKLTACADEEFAPAPEEVKYPKRA